ncbi:hypothetical protein [Bacillus tuaregi]|uniref:hypothetical protein n=1 Tax=Bacillus tuaregi TaxID=1816695 RepID=UPI0008F92306|nr:hypothetical protein [Bacillus tuaregi]
MNKIIHLLAMMMLTIITIYMINNYVRTAESFTYFPPDQEASFLSAETALSLAGDTNNGYAILWKASSLLDRKAYLRQDISFLYVNGILQAKLGKEWKKGEDKIYLDKNIMQHESANFKAISFHHAELHNNNNITSSQRITHDELYVVQSKFTQLHSFRYPKGKEDKEWKFIIDQMIEEHLKQTLSTAEKTFDLAKAYTVYPLTDMYQFENSPLPGFDEQETKKILGRLWEGIYKNYFLGIQRMDGTTADPIGSTIPLILLAKDQSHLLVISMLRDGEAMILRQQIPAH